MGASAAGACAHAGAWEPEVPAWSLAPSVLRPRRRCVGVLAPEVFRGDLVQPVVSDLVDGQRVGLLGVVAYTEGEDIEGQCSGLLAGDQVHDAPRSVGAGDTGLHATRQARSGGCVLVAREQLVDG